MWGGLLARALGWRGTIVFWKWADVCGRVKEGLGCVVGLDGGDDFGIRPGSFEGLMDRGWCWGGCAG